jgi:type IV secretion system protein VirD4
MRAMPTTPPLGGSGGSEADVEAERQAADGQSSGKTDVARKKTAPVVQAVVAEEQRQMEMDFGGQVTDAEAASAVGEAQMRCAVDGLDDMEAMLRDGGGQALVVR